MFYILLKQKIQSLASSCPREIITVANKECFTDLLDIWPMATPSKTVMEADEFEEFLKSGYATEKEAKKDKKMLKSIKDYVWTPFSETSYTFADEEYLRAVYKESCKNGEVCPLFVKKVNGEDILVLRQIPECVLR